MTILLSNIQVWPWPSTYLNNVSNEQLCQIILKSMHKCRSYDPDTLNLWPSYNLTFKSDLDFNLPEQMLQMALLLHNENNCAKSFEIHA